MTVRMNGGAHPDDFVRVKPVYATDPGSGNPTVVGYTIDQAPPTVTDPITGAQVTCPSSWSLYPSPVGSFDFQGEEEVLSRTVDGAQHRLLLANKGNYVTGWRTIIGSDYDQEWVSRQPGFGAACNPAIFFTQAFDRQSTDSLQINPTFAGAEDRTPIESTPSSVPIFRRVSTDDDGNVIIETAVHPLHFRNPGVPGDQGDLGYDNPAGDETFLFWRYIYFQRIEPNWRGRKNVHRCTNWLYIPDRYSDGDTPQFAPMNLSGGGCGMPSADSTNFQHLYSVDLVTGISTLLEWPGFDGANPAQIYRFRRDQTLLAPAISGISVAPAVMGSGYGAAFFKRTSDNFCLALATRLEYTDFDLTRRTELTVGNIDAPPPNGVPGRLGNGRNCNIAATNNTYGGMRAGWIGASALFFTGAFADALPALTLLQTDGSLDLTAPTDLPDEIIALAGIGPDGVEALATFIVEDGSLVTDANSYSTVANADIYHANRGNPATWADATDADKQEALRQATSWMDMRYGTSWCGTRVDSGQSLMWPRTGVIDRDTNLIADTTMPTALQKACAEAALESLLGTVLMPTVAAGSGGVRQASTTVGPISTSRTFQGGQSTSPSLPKVDALLAGGGLIASFGWGAR